MSKHWSHHLQRLSDVLERPRFGIISDFDGTLSPFVSQPEQAAITPENAAALDALAEHVTVIALVSGRGVADLRQRFVRPWLEYYGNHGMEFWRDGQPQLAAEAVAWVQPLQALLRELDHANTGGVVIENKGATAAVHYRNAPDTARAREALYQRLKPLAEQYGLRLSEGQLVWEIKPPVTLHKGTAAQAIIQAYRLESVLYLGDDVTDFNAMRLLRQLASDPRRHLRALSVGVVHPTSFPELYEVCDLTADGPDDVAHLLNWIRQQRRHLQQTTTDK
ncbi:MAG: trehalose-phosphatase [Chloroflexi bacterium]|nr:trehalose-phosphatase [Chloroflexota bacterium]